MYDSTVPKSYEAVFVCRGCPVVGQQAEVNPPDQASEQSCAAPLGAV
jgi:hypothetical protein